MIWLRRRGAKPEPELEEGEEYADVDSNLLRQIWDIACCLLLIDLWDYMISKVQGRPQYDPDEDQFAVAPTAIPFGPFMALGFFLTTFFGEWMAHAYLSYAFPPIK